MLTLWGLLSFAKEKDSQRIQIARDSMVIVKWLQGSYSIASLVLDSWKRKIKASEEAFINIDIEHISRIYNVMANVLSNRALRISPGLMQVDEVVDGKVVSSSCLFVFQFLGPYLAFTTIVLALILDLSCFWFSFVLTYCVLLVTVWIWAYFVELCNCSI